MADKVPPYHTVQPAGLFEYLCSKDNWNMWIQPNRGGDKEVERPKEIIEQTKHNESSDLLFSIIKHDFYLHFRVIEI